MIHHSSRFERCLSEIARAAARRSPDADAFLSDIVRTGGGGADDVGSRRQLAEREAKAAVRQQPGHSRVLGAVLFFARYALAS